MYGFDNQSTATLRRWRKEGDETGYIYIYSTHYTAAVTTGWAATVMEDASFFHSADTSLYRTKKLVQRLKIQNLSAYLTAENIYTWTNYTGRGILKYL